MQNVNLVNVKGYLVKGGLHFLTAATDELREGFVNSFLGWAAFIFLHCKVEHLKLTHSPSF